MHPILFELGPITIYSYGVLLAAAYLLGLWMAARRARQAGLDANKVLDLGIWVIIAALVGAKALLFVVDFEHFTSSWQEFTTLLRSGGVFYGGLIAAVLVCIYQLRKHKLPLWTSGDLFAPGIALGYMVGRLGCLMAGCCYGKPTDVAVGDHVHRSGRQPECRHAAQRAAASDAALRVAGRPGHLRRAAVHRAARPQLPRPDVLAVRAALLGVALRHRVLPRRRSRHGCGRCRPRSSSRSSSRRSA